MPPETGRELEALRELAIATSASLEADEILGIVRERALALFQADFSAVALAGPGWEELAHPDPTGHPPFPPQLREILRGVVQSGESSVVPEVPPDPQLPLGEWSAAANGFRSAVAVPIRHRDGVRGALLLAWREPTPVPPGTVGLAETLGVQTAVALHNARLYQELKRTTEARNRFFSAMSHDLRTPIAAIVGYSELLADGIVGELSPKQHEMVERISQVAAHLTELVNDVLDLARLDAGQVELHPRPVRLGELVEEAALAVEPQAREKQLPVRLELDPVGGETLVVDHARVRQILVNLLSNAVKFTRQGEVRVRAGIRGARPWITVEDTGPGLPEGSEEAVFEEFLQLASGRGYKQEPGSGLGLAVSRRLARAMGGDLTAESTPGVGAAFTLYLPPRGEEAGDGG